ncbi:hypothetical protein RvY_18488 [Ramazzottius varieornatus]|uniref:Uncharacterized protein n=1 Tax=Ramazzottius varieornatus TaxID=947166 RepID=A0A1D1W5Z2_RAMVA|nr:hypothetical protein RvY_18488 [Ramazzottius varieornatus]
MQNGFGRLSNDLHHRKFPPNQSKCLSEVFRSNWSIRILTLKLTSVGVQMMQQIRGK